MRWPALKRRSSLRRRSHFGPGSAICRSNTRRRPSWNGPSSRLGACAGPCISSLRRPGHLRSGFRPSRGARDPVGAQEGRLRPRPRGTDRCCAERAGPATHSAGARRTREQVPGGANAGIRRRGWGSRTRVPAVAVGGLTFPMVYLLHLVGARGVICSGPSRGTEPTFVRADAWIPQWRDVPREEAERELLRRYLRAFGPATPSDFAAWTGMPLAGAREIWVQEEANMAPVSVDNWGAAVLRDDLLDLKRAVFDRPPVRLLPYFDSFLLGHLKKREHLVAARDHKNVYRAQGCVDPRSGGDSPPRPCSEVRLDVATHHVWDPRGITRPRAVPRSFQRGCSDRLRRGIPAR